MEPRSEHQWAVTVSEVDGEYVVADPGGWIGGTYPTVADALRAAADSIEEG